MHRPGQSRLSNILLILNLRSAYEKASRLGISKKQGYPRKFLRQTWAQAFCWWSVTFQSEPFFKIMRRRMLAKRGQTRAISFSPGMIFFKRPPDRLNYLSSFFHPDMEFFFRRFLLLRRKEQFLLFSGGSFK